MASARSQFDPPALTPAWTEGFAMTLDQAVAYALQGAAAESDEDPFSDFPWQYRVRQ
jgi:hypothetical protein